MLPRGAQGCSSHRSWRLGSKVQACSATRSGFRRTRWGLGSTPYRRLYSSWRPLASTPSGAGSPASALRFHVKPRRLRCRPVWVHPGPTIPPRPETRAGVAVPFAPARRPTPRQGSVSRETAPRRRRTTWRQTSADGFVLFRPPCRSSSGGSWWYRWPISRPAWRI